VEESPSESESENGCGGGGRWFDDAIYALLCSSSILRTCLYSWLLVCLFFFFFSFKYLIFKKKN
jgi:hypothetical protein